MQLYYVITRDGRVLDVRWFLRAWQRLYNSFVDAMRQVVAALVDAFQPLCDALQQTIAALGLVGVPSDSVRQRTPATSAKLARRRRQTVGMLNRVAP